MKNRNAGLVVICSFQPKPGKQKELLDLLNDHVPTLRMLGFASGYPRSTLIAENGNVIEIFEWESEEASRKAHEHPEVQKIWNAIGAIAEAVPLSSMKEAQKPFASFKKTENTRTNRVIHFEIEANDPAKVSKFYEQVFNWQFTRWQDNPYWLADTGYEPCPGIDGAVMEKKSPDGGVTNTVVVESLDESIEKVKRAGGKICGPKMIINGVGYLAYGSDPEGNTFGMMQPDMSAK